MNFDLQEYLNKQNELNDMIFEMKRIYIDRYDDGRPVILNSKILKDDKDLTPNGIKNQWLGNFSKAMRDELRELDEELLWKWWSKDELDTQNIKVELIDIFHFWLSLVNASGMDSQDVERIYNQKYEVNKERQRKGYSKANKDEADNKGIK